MRKLALLILSVFVALPLVAQTKSLLNVDKSNLAIQGYDPVAFFTDNKPVKGKAEFKSTWSGATYYFASAEHKADFDKDPAKYEPAFGGYCAYGVSKNKLVETDPEAFQIMDGRLLLQYSKGARRKSGQSQNELARFSEQKRQIVCKDGLTGSDELATMNLQSLAGNRALI